MKNTYQKLKLTNGEEVKLTLNFARLLKIRNERKDLYEKLMKILQGKGDFDAILDTVTVLYIGYLCGLDKDQPCLLEEEFLELVEFDLEKINTIVANLISSKKK